MELDDLKSLWQKTEHRLESLESGQRLSARLARAGALNNMNRKVRFAHFVLWYELAFGVVAALLIGSYIVDHFGAIEFAAPAAVLHLGAIATIGVSAWQLATLARVDYGGPIAEIQHRLAEVSLVRARYNRWLILSSPLLWAVLVIVAPHALFGGDIYRIFGPAWVAGNFAFGLAFLALAIWASRRFPSSRFLTALGADLTGRRLAAASGFLDELMAFEGER